MIIGEVMNAMYNLLQECSEEKGWQKPTIETIQGNFRTLEYIIWLENKLDHYKRLAEAAGILIEREYEIRPNIIYLSEYERYNSILQEREGKK